MSEALALIALAVTLAAALARPRWAPDWIVAVAGAAVVVGATSFTVAGAWSAVRTLGPTVGFLAALLVLADGARRAGVFQALGGVMAAGARGDPRRLLGMVFLAAAATTVVLSIDSTIVLLTPVVLVTAARLRIAPRPHAYACTHLANSASLLLPISNLTNLLALAASGLSFTRFAALMALPWAVAIGIEWVVLSRGFTDELGGPNDGVADAGADRVAPRPTGAAEPAEALPTGGADSATPLPAGALAVIGLTLAGFVASSPLGIAPVWIAAAGAAALTALAPPPSAIALARGAAPEFLVFVLGLGIVVTAAGRAGLDSVVDSLLPGGTGLPALLAIAGVSALAANLLNNLPATLILAPALAPAGPVAVLVMLIGVDVGPNLTYVGSLATLLWRRVLHEHDQTVAAGGFLRLGLLTVVPTLAAATVALWAAAHLV